MDKLKTLTLRVSPEEHKQIKRLSVETGRTVKDLMLECLQRLIREYEGTESKIPWDKKWSPERWDPKKSK